MSSLYFSHAGQTDIGGLVVSGSSNYSGTNSGGQMSVDAKKASFGAGANAVLAGGYMLHKNFGVELAVGIGVAPKKYEYTSTFKQVSTTTTNDVSKFKVYTKLPVMIMPSVVLQTGGSNLNVYSRLGVAVPVSGKIIVEQTRTYQDGADPATVRQQERELTTRMAIGFQGALGVQARLGEKLRFYLELNGLTMNAYAKKASLTKDVLDGVDQLPSRTTSEKETEFEFSYSEIDPHDSSKPVKSTPFSVPYSNIGVGLGIVLML